MKHFPLLGMAVLALTGCKEAKESASGDPAAMKPSKTGERPAKQSAPAKEDLPYPEGLKLIEAAEQTSGAMSALMRSHRDLFIPDMTKILGQGNRQPEPPTPPTPEEEQAKAKVVEVRKAHMAAMVALTRYEGSEFEEAQITAFQERHRLRQQVSGLQDRLQAATKANDPAATDDSLQNALTNRKRALEDMEAAWTKISAGGWRDQVEPAGG
jgi:hypothetical protein